jgi:hypothetical protein
MKLLLTSSGISNPSISDALVELLGKPIAESSALHPDRPHFTLYPHLGREDMPDTSLANIEKWASGIPVPTYAIDYETAIKVIDSTVEVVSEGNWKPFNP